MEIGIWAILVLAIVIALAVYVLQTAELPPPVIWIGWVVLLVAILFVVLKVAGISIPT